MAKVELQEIGPALARDAIPRQGREADVKLAEMIRQYRESPDQKLELDRLALEKIRNDPFHLNRLVGGSATAEREEQAIVARIRVAEAAAAGQAAVPADVDITYGTQIPRRDLADAVGTLVEHGVRKTFVESFLATGKSDGGEPREYEIAMAREWQRRLMADPELQRKFLAKDPQIMREFDYFAGYAPDPRLST
jgi:hypothetical protein